MTFKELTMNTLKNSFKTLNVLALVMSCHLHATILSDDDHELMSIDAPQHKVEQKALHFSQAINKNNTFSLAPSEYTTTSDEYWLEVSGEQLKSGVILDVNQPGALIRLSGKISNIPGAVESLVIDPNQIQLSKDKKSLASPFSQKVTQQQFASANVFPNSSAVKLNEAIGRGQFKLKVNQPLYNHERYLVNVKEKGSEHRLTLSIPTQTLVAKQALTFDLAMNNAKGPLATHSDKALIKTPTGEFLAVKTAIVDGKQTIALPDGLTANNRGELFELHISSQASDNGLTVKRNGKVAFAITQPTAKMTGNVKIKRSHANIELHIASEGRYEVSAVVSGIDQQGKSAAVILSRSAYFLTPGEKNVKLMFDASLLKSSHVSPPYSLSQLRLVDQSRMALLQQE